MGKVIRATEKQLSEILRVSPRRIREVFKNSKLEPGKYDLIEAIGDFVDQSRQGNKDHVTLKRLAEILGTTDRHIRNLLDENILVKMENDKFDLIENIRKFINHLRATNANQRYKDAQTKLLELKYKAQSRELHSTDEIEEYLSRMIVNFKQRLLAIPSKASKELVNKSNRHEIEKQLKELLYEAMEELATYADTY